MARKNVQLVTDRFEFGKVQVRLGVVRPPSLLCCGKQFLRVVAQKVPVNLERVSLGIDGQQRSNGVDHVPCEVGGLVQMVALLHGSRKRVNTIARVAIQDVEFDSGHDGTFVMSLGAPGGLVGGWKLSYDGTCDG